MTTLLLAAMLLGPANQGDAFMVRAELQGLYDEASQARLQFVTASDVELFHDVFVAPDWIFVDPSGQKHTWEEMRGSKTEEALSPRADWVEQIIRSVSIVANGATAVVNRSTDRTIVDDEGRYGKPGATHTLTESTVFRDTWVRLPDGWKLKAREQVGEPVRLVDKPSRST